MLLTAPVRQDFHASLAAITHVDGTARVQTLTSAQDKFVYLVLREFERLTGFPILLNTSFNLAEEPIVESPHDALSTFVRSDIDALVIENFIVTKD
jgi:carbamoyltransferase